MTDREIKIVVCDIDGVLTNGMVYIDEKGHEYKAFRLTELDALNDIKRLGIKLMAITGESTPIVELFERRIGWDSFVKGCKDKGDEIKKLCIKNDMIQDEVCYIGDGKYDIPAIQYAGLGVCPNNAIQEVKDVADIVLKGNGGENCIYELYHLLKNKEY